MKNWKEIEFSKFAKLTKGISYTSSDYCNEGEGAIFVTLKCIAKAGGFSQRGIKYFKGFIPKRQLIKKGDLLFANTDLTRNGDIVGCPVYLPDLGNDYQVTMSMDLSRVDFIDENIDPEFIYYKMMSDDVRKFMKENSSGSTVLHLKTSKVPTLKLSIPESKPEQTRIAQILATADHAIAETEALLAKYQRLKTGLMQDLLTRGIDEHGAIRGEGTHRFKDSVLGRIPFEWEVKTIGNLVTQVLDFKANGSFETLTANVKYYYEPNYARLIRLTDLRNGLANKGVYIDKKGFQFLKKTRLVEGDILISCVGEYTGFVCQMPKVPYQSTIAPNMFVMRFKDEIEPSFIAKYMTSSFFQNEVAVVSTSSATKLLNNPNLRALRLIIPPKEEQIVISKNLDAFDKLISEGKMNLNKLITLKTALMQDLLTGKVRVHP
jgi:type I restriction enzyme, S subunit